VFLCRLENLKTDENNRKRDYSISKPDQTARQVYQRLRLCVYGCGRALRVPTEPNEERRKGGKCGGCCM